MDRDVARSGFAKMLDVSLTRKSVSLISTLPLLYSYNTHHTSYKNK
jgi:hypothetical protein